MRGGTAYSSSPFELKLQLHGQVSNPYSFNINSSVEVNSKIMQIRWSYTIDPTDLANQLPIEFSFSFPQGYSKLMCGTFDLNSLCTQDGINTVRIIENDSKKGLNILVNEIYEDTYWFQSRDIVQIVFELK